MAEWTDEEKQELNQLVARYWVLAFKTDPPKNMSITEALKQIDAEIERMNKIGTDLAEKLSVYVDSLNLQDKPAEKKENK
jgi:hypothetical protein